MNALVNYQITQSIIDWIIYDFIHKKQKLILYLEAFLEYEILKILNIIVKIELIVYLEMRNC